MRQHKGGQRMRLAKRRETWRTSGLHLYYPVSSSWIDSQPARIKEPEVVDLGLFAAPRILLARSHLSSCHGVDLPGPQPGALR